MNKFRNAFYLLALLLFCCRKPYTPPAITAPNSYLVVEGVINSGSDSTIIKLSKTVNLNSQVTKNPVLEATVTVESNQNNTWHLTGDLFGNYTAFGLNLPPSQMYRLRVITSDGHQYVSDFTAVKPTPPIDSIGYTTTSTGIQLYVNTHDPANNTHYYRWDYQEAWIFHAKYESLYTVDSATSLIVPRSTAQNVYFCYGNDVSSHLLLNSTAKLSKDVVYQSPLVTIPFSSEKLEVTYGILLRQYALTGDAYQFYQNILTNTENLGSIFDAQPSEIIGNIHSVTNPNEPVIGYMSVTNVQSKIIFITSSIVPTNIQTIYPYDCEQDTALFMNKQGYNDVNNILISRPLTDLPTQALLSPTGSIEGYLYSDLQCTDCAIRGALQEPWFWK